MKTEATLEPNTIHSLEYVRSNKKHLTICVKCKKPTDKIVMDGKFKGWCGKCVHLHISKK